MSSRLRSRRFLPQVEVLESRLAPARLVIPTTVDYIDVDGDSVKVIATEPVFTPAMFTFDNAFNTPGPQQLRTIDLSGIGTANNSLGLYFTVKRAQSGDGLANVGRINATGIDLGRVEVAGDLGDIDAGDGTTSTPGLASLTVQSLGNLGFSTGSQDLTSDIVGMLARLTVKGDVNEAHVRVQGGADGKIGTVTIGGALIGGVTPFSGRISSDSGIGAVSIEGDVRGGDGAASGQIYAGGFPGASIKSVTIGGSLIGGGGNESGYVRAGEGIGPVNIKGNIQGGGGTSSGVVTAGTTLTRATVGGSLIGSASDDTGVIVSGGDMGAVNIRGSVNGGGHYSGSVVSGGKLAGATVGGSVIGGSGIDSGMIGAEGDMRAVKITGDLRGGSNLGTGQIVTSGKLTSVKILGSMIAGSVGPYSGAIYADRGIGSITIKGDVIGNANNAAVIAAGGPANPTAKKNVAIGKLTISGRVEYANILGGYNLLEDPTNGNAQIGPVSVGKDWIASNLVAGVHDGVDNLFGTADDAIIGGGASIASIKSITIGGQVTGTDGGSDRFGFVSQTIGAMKIARVKIALTAAQDAKDLGATGDVRLLEIGAIIPLSPPAAPTGLTATPTGGTTAALTWTDNADNETGFKIERKQGEASSFVEIATVGADTTSFNDSGLSFDTEYTYRVRATNAAGDSAFSNEDSAITFFPA